MQGRRVIYTDEQEITSENIIKVLQDSMAIHRTNSSECDFLIKYEQGNQPLKREKTYRSDINIICQDNICAEIIGWKIGFKWSNPITLVQRGEKDSGKENKAEMEGIALLNECYQAEGYDKKMQDLARQIEICGIGYTYVDINTEYEEGDSYFTVNTLDCRNTFIVRSNNVGNKPLLGVTYRQDLKGNTHFTCFSKDRRYEVLNLVVFEDKKLPKQKEKWLQGSRSGEKNPLGMIPIIEWTRNADRLGAFERVISECDTLNIMVSDVANQIDQNTQAIWWGNDIEFPTDEQGNVESPKSNDWILTKTPPNGKAPSINPMSIACDYTGMLSNIAQRRAWILEKCNVPQRNDNSGGSTGVAMDSANGWSSAECSASAEELITKACKMEEVKVVLKAINKSAKVPSDSPLLKLRYIDITPKIKRQKTYEMVTKINAFATGISHGLDYKALIKNINFFDDEQQVIIDSEPTIKKYLEATFKVEEKADIPANANAQNPNENEKERNAQDESDQIENSPFVDGMSKTNPDGKKEDKNNVDNKAK